MKFKIEWFDQDDINNCVGVIETGNTIEIADTKELAITNFNKVHKNLIITGITNE